MTGADAEADLNSSTPKKNEAGKGTTATGGGPCLDCAEDQINLKTASYPHSHFHVLIYGQKRIFGQDE